MPWKNWIKQSLSFWTRYDPASSMSYDLQCCFKRQVVACFFFYPEEKSIEKNRYFPFLPLGKCASSVEKEPIYSACKHWKSNFCSCVVVCRAIMCEGPRNGTIRNTRAVWLFINGRKHLQGDVIIDAQGFFLRVFYATGFCKTVSESTAEFVKLRFFSKIVFLVKSGVYFRHYFSPTDVAKTVETVRKYHRTPSILSQIRGYRRVLSERICSLWFPLFPCDGP